MLSPDLSNCPSCPSIPKLLCSIDDKITELARINYANIVFELDRPYSKSLVKTLLKYKKIFTEKLFNPSYTDYSNSVLISRVKTLLNE